MDHVEGRRAPENPEPRHRSSLGDGDLTTEADSLELEHIRARSSLVVSESDSSLSQSLRCPDSFFFIYFILSLSG